MGYRLNELIDLPRLQKLTEAFSKSTGFPTTVVDPQGNVLFESGYQRLCTFFHRQNSQTRQRCVEMDPHQAALLVAGPSGVLQQCRNGLYYASVPIMLGKDLLGGVIVGQLLFDKPDEQYFRQQAQQHQFDEVDYLKAVAEVPLLDASRLPAVLEFLQQYASLLAEIGLREQKRMQAQAALRQSEKDYRLLADNVIDVIWRLDLKTMRFTYISPSIQRMRGFTVGEALAHGIAESVDQQSLDYISRELPRRLKGYSEGDASARVQTDVVRQPCKDGSWIWVEMVTTLIAGEDGEVYEILGVSRDITARKRAEIELRTNQDRLEMALRGGNLGSFDANFQTGITFFDDRWAEIIGFSTSELNPQERIWANLVHPDDLVRVNTALERCLNGEIPMYEVEYRMRTKSGEWKWISARGRVMERGADGRAVRFSGTHQDITERKYNEDLLRRLAQRLENLHEIDRAILAGLPLPDICGELLARLRSQLACQRVDIVFSMPDGQNEVVLTTDSDGSLLVNELEKKFSRLLQTATSEDIQEYQIIHDLAEVPLTNALHENLKAAGLRSFLSIPLNAAGQRYGSLRLCSNEPRAFSTGAIELAVEMAAELALAMQQTRLREEVARRAMELENRVAARTSQLQTANRELETFSYSVAHDLKTPLRGIEGYSRLLLEEYSGRLEEQAQAYLNHIERASLKMSQLIDDLLKYSRLDRRSKVLGQANIPELVRTILLERDDEIKRRQVTVQVDVQCDIVTVELEGLTQALRNLLDNALKFTGASPDPHLEIGGREYGENCLIWFRDNGIGFDMKYHDRIFKVFERLHREDDYSGTGIGLAIVRKAMERMGGRAWAESLPGQGAVFYLEFPRFQA
jgi:PAS domain S-box-containing protein